MRIVVYECSNCRKRHWDSTNMRRHAHSKQCEGATLTRRVGIVTFVDEPRDDPIPRPRVPAAIEKMRGRVPTYDDGDDDRIEALFDDPDAVRDFLHISDASLVGPFLFARLWGVRAPERLRSIGVSGGTVHEIGADGEVTVRGQVRKKYVREVLSYVLEVARAILAVCVPLRLPELADRARMMMAMLDAPHEHGLTLRDAVARTDAFCRRRPPSLTRVVETAETTMYACFVRDVWMPS